MNNQFRMEAILDIFQSISGETHYIHFHVYADINYSILLNYFLRSWFEKQTLTVTETSITTNSSPLCSRYKMKEIKRQDIMSERSHFIWKRPHTAQTYILYSLHLTNFLFFLFIEKPHHLIQIVGITFTCGPRS